MSAVELTYDDLDEPTLGTILQDGDSTSTRDALRMLYIYAPESVNDIRPWTTAYTSPNTRYSTEDVWRRAKDPTDKCSIVYDPRVDLKD